MRGGSYERKLAGFDLSEPSFPSFLARAPNVALLAPCPMGSGDFVAIINRSTKYMARSEGKERKGKELGRVIN